MTTSIKAGPTVCFTDSYWFPTPPLMLWEHLGRFESYPSWWRWLRDFATTSGGDGLVAGVEMRGTVVPPVPYRLSLQVVLDRCVVPGLIEARVMGDLRGDAVLRLVAVDEGTCVTAEWSLMLVSAPLRLAARVASPLVRWGHDQVVSMAVTGFRQRAMLPPS